MIANLPLLFANGHPTALSEISAADLEKFITFMVTCSWGHDTAKEIRQPPWWPQDVTFSHPFVKPREVPKNWESRLKNLVKKCYDYHKSAFLLVFSAQLARYPRKRLRYVDNRDHTTSLYYRPNGRLLVTFRNENMFYDKLPKHEVKSTDIYLCDNCDSHFDNLEILRAHERLCNNENVPTSSCSGGLTDLLSALKLKPVGQKADNPVSVIDEKEAKPKSFRNSASIDRGPPYPFSSLAYMKTIKSNIQRDTSYSRERVERYCCTTTIPPTKQVGSKSKNQQFPIRYRRPIDYWHRMHIFPNQRNKRILDKMGQLLLFKCKPVTIKIDRMSLDSMHDYIDKLRKESENRVQSGQDKDIVFVDGLDCDQPVDVEMKRIDPLKRADNDCEVIDLCSDDETPSVNENCDPRAGAAGAAVMAGAAGMAGVACVMRGGAVLRRHAATPQALRLPPPAEPCGARQRPLLPAVLQPHPVILIAHTLNSLQTISLE